MLYKSKFILIFFCILAFCTPFAYAGYYGYDGNGERVYKLTGVSSFSQINSGTTNAQVILDDAAVYPNPYVVVTTRGYTKHYYAGTERLATVIGTGGFGDISPPCRVMTQSEYATIVDPFFMRYSHHTTNPFNYEYKLEKEMVIEDINGGQPSNLQYACHAKDLEYVDVISQGDLLLTSITQNSSIQNQETDRYYYHGDHLGSASWITERHGIPVQYIHYAPYGELIANQMPLHYNERYKFTGKERDSESGYDFFGARYLWSTTGHWLSVDPMADKYPNISPYAYCGWNPIKYVDPDGKRCSLSVNYRTNTITISAKYYASRNDSRYAMKAADFWNNQKGQTYTANDGKVYSVQYALSVYSSKNPEKDAGTDDNSFKVVNTLGTNVEGNKKTGETIANYKISIADAYKEESTGAHEIGHTLMNVPKGEGSEHAATGVMTKSISDDGRSWSVSQETVNNIVESNGFNQNPTLWQKIKSWFE